MFSWLKKHFIPHEDNNHRPHILRKNNVRSIIVVVLFLELVVFLIPTLGRINITEQMAAVLPAVLSILTNEERQAQNLQTLTVNPILNQAAEMKANDMVTYGYFAHVSPDGKTPWYWLEQVGYQYQYAGENLAVDFSDSKDVTNAWMASPSHRENIVKGNYTEMGTGVAYGVFQGRTTIFVAQ
ncbi:MAG: CAP domain-containing protein, partial [Candidatus Paceibacterota bacterium]